MGLMNWPAVVLAAIVAMFTLIAIGRQQREARYAGIVLAAMFVSAAMLGHSFARIGSATLAAKPWLYPMQSGGLALAFVIPALWVNGARLRESLPWLLAYLAMGAVFWLLGLMSGPGI